MSDDPARDRDRGPARPSRIRGRLAVLAVLAVIGTLMAFAGALGSTTCSTVTACRAMNNVLLLTGFGGWLLLILAAVGWALLADRRPDRAAWPANAAIPLALLLLLTIPTYDHFRDGTSGTTQQGRARRHAEARRRLVEVVDGTVRAVRPHGTPQVMDSPGTRDPNDNGTCEYELYQVSLRVPAADQPATVRAAAEHWRGLGFSVGTVNAGIGFLRAESSDLAFAISTDKYRDDVDIVGTGPCLRPG